METVTPRKPMLYFGSTGLGEMIAQTPVMRQLSLFGYDIVLVAPENLRRYFASIPYIKEFISYDQSKFQDLGKGTFKCDSLCYLPGSCHWNSCHWRNWQDGPMGMKKVSEGHGGSYPENYMSKIFGEEYSRELNPRAYIMDAPEVEPYEGGLKVVVSHGSFEALRRFSGTVIESLLEKYGQNSALPDRDMGRALRMIKACEVLVTPDSGHFWAALALGKKVVVMPSREHIMHPEVYHNKVAIYSVHNPSCAQECRRLTGEAGEGYPMNMKCWGTHAPCLTWANIDRITNLVDSLLAPPVDTAPSSCSPQGEES